MDWIQEIPENLETPAYVFDQNTLRKRAAYLRERLPGALSLCFAVKANPFLVKELAPLTDRLEVCSPGELRICQELGVAEEKLVISGVYKTPEVMAELVKKNAAEMGRSGKSAKTCLYTVESTAQAELLSSLAIENGTQLPVLVRLTSGNQFGMDPEEILQLFRRDPEGLIFRGIQFFSGTQKTSLKKVKRELSEIGEFLRRLRDVRGEWPEELELGTGFPVAYFEGEAFDEEEYLKAFCQELSALDFPGKITLEIGRSLAASCGTYLTRVADRKINKKEAYAILDGGIHQLVYFGQMMAMKKPCLSHFPERKEGEERCWNLCGSLCTVNDLLVKQLPVRDLQIGDLFAFHNTGAYSMTEGISLFLSRDLPEVWLREEDGSFRCLRERVETAEFNLPDYDE